MNIDQAGHDVASVQAFRILAACYDEPTADLTGLLSDAPGCLEPLGEGVTTLVGGLTAAVDHCDPQDLLKDYAKLFVGPFELLAPPFGSVYLEDRRRLLGDSTADAKRYYQLAGLDMAEDFRLPPDHVVAEFEFLAYLYSQEVQATDAQDKQRFRTIRNNFLTSHIGVWGPEFAGKVELNADTEFYRRLADLTRHLLAQAGQNLAADAS